jgi:hypothetical protein
MSIAVVYFGTQTPAHTAYFRAHGYKVLEAPSNTHPFAVHTVFPGHDFLLCWNACVAPKPGARDLRPLLNLQKINVTWDSYGRNYPHKTSRRWSLDLIGFPAKHTALNYDMLETQDLHILPKDVNVQEGYLEFQKAQFANLRSEPTVSPVAPKASGTFVKHYDPVTGRY